MTMVVRQSASAKAALRRLHTMRIVVPEHARSVPVMQRQVVTNAMWNVRAGFDKSRFDLHPKSPVLLEDAFIEQQKRLETWSVAGHY
jgi:hypothetical protein